MLSWILGTEDSFFKSLIYDVYLGSALVIFGSMIYLVTVGGPLAINKYVNK